MDHSQFLFGESAKIRGFFFKQLDSKSRLTIFFPLNGQNTQNDIKQSQTKN